MALDKDTKSWLNNFIEIRNQDLRDILIVYSDNLICMSEDTCSTQPQFKYIMLKL